MKVVRVLTSCDLYPPQTLEETEAGRNWWTTIPVDKVQEALLEDVPPAVFVPGCGVREIPMYLREIPGIQHVVGMDTDANVLSATYDEVQRVAPGFRGLELIPGDATKPGVLDALGRERFGVVTSVGLCVNVPRFEDLFRLMLNANDALVPGGSFVISDFVLEMSGKRRLWRRRYHRDADALEAQYPHLTPAFGTIVTRPFDMSASDNIASLDQGGIERAVLGRRYGRLVRHWDENVFLRVLRRAGFDIVSAVEQWISEGAAECGDELDSLLNIVVRGVKRDWRAVR